MLCCGQARKESLTGLLKGSAEWRGGEYQRFTRLQVLLLLILLFKCGGSESVSPVEIKINKLLLS